MFVSMVTGEEWKTGKGWKQLMEYFTGWFYDGSKDERLGQRRWKWKKENSGWY
jgi:hypothetical protein